MKTTTPVHPLSDALLKDYTAAALSNAEQLTQEAGLLLAHGHHARAYFLAVAAIEECGKAYTTHEGRGRDLSNPAIVHRLQKSIADHHQKLNSALLPWIRRMSNPREEIVKLVEVIVALQRGREPSMYSDIRFDGSGIHQPSEVVKPEVAGNCVRLSVEIWKQTAAFLAETPPSTYSRTHNALFEIRPDKLTAMTNTADFAAFLLFHLEAGQTDTAKIWVTHYRDYFQKGVQFQQTEATRAEP
ncbi:AbiV family abortive infection protein [Paucibacter sp. R3-3]|uniref:AbiV family abortive infection protein n=1 Tax=Roseateles agri TaxID=3098619 RepID=A0ABU5DIG4_9BURK|nr:AbiV family abortive infection protein [Paucibacter sp. R3-3]MDY0745944.1 AbiV family abortive infection protein [Paucibacter sp. R3-3]